MTDETVSTAKVGQVDIAYETFGKQDHPPVVLIMGFASQMLSWPDDFCRALAERGHFVVRFDNRDVGLSTHMRDAPPPNVMGAFLGDFSSVTYRLTDMADDVAGLIDVLGLGSAHIVGASLGGMIAQTLAIEHPRLTRSLTSIMSTTGSRAVGQPAPAAMQVLMTSPPTNRAEAIERIVAAYRVIGSPGFALDVEGVRDIAGRSYDRSFDPAGAQRQLVAVLASGDRTSALRGVTAPTLVVHGAQDPMIDVSGGRATAAAIPGAELMIVEGMGHDLSRNVLLPLVDPITALVARAEARRRPVG